MPHADPAVVQSPERLNALHRLNLLDSAPEEAFDRLTRLASHIIGAPVSLVALVDAERQFFKSAVGLPEPWASKRETPLSHSFCQHVVATNKPLIIEDAREHELVYDNLAVPNLNVIAYLGMPLSTSDGAGLGSFCVIDGKPRQWSEHDIYILHELAQSAITEIELRAEVRQRKAAEKALRQLNAELDSVNHRLKRVTEFTYFTINHTIDTVRRGAEREEILTYLDSAQRSLKPQAN
jgi:GAF domain-containing protein